MIKLKPLVELNALERQVRSKLESDEAIDVEYWESLLSIIGVYKAKGELKLVYQTLLSKKALHYLKEQLYRASKSMAELEPNIHENSVSRRDEQGSSCVHSAILGPKVGSTLDSEPDLRIRADDRSLEVMEEKVFVDQYVSKWEVPLTEMHSLVSRER